MNKLSSPDAKVKHQHTWLSSKLDTATGVAVPFIPPFESGIQRHKPWKL